MCYMDMERNGWNVAVEEFMKSASQELTDSSGDKNLVQFVSCNHSHTFAVIYYVSRLPSLRAKKLRFR